MEQDASRFRVVIVMGPAGSGKTTVGKALARNLGVRFLDADDAHPPEAKAKMATGKALTDQDREPWLKSLRASISASLRGETEKLVLACSALKAHYREVLGVDNDAVRLVFLSVPRAELGRRLALRTGHFAGPSLLDSQLETLEVPEQGLHLDGTLPLPRLVAHISDWIRRPPLASPLEP
jgi:gluconokinase